VNITTCGYLAETLNTEFDGTRITNIIKTLEENVTINPPEVD
jgi:hypothetical protein